MTMCYIELQMTFITGTYAYKEYYELSVSLPFCFMSKRKENSMH